MIRVWNALLAVLVASAALAACSSAPPAATLPNGITLASQGSAAMRAIKSAAVAITVDQGVTAVPLRSATGKLTSTAQAEGTAVLAIAGGPALEYQFVATGGVLYLKGATGGFQPLPLAAAGGIYDPTAILNPERGVAFLLSSATAPTTAGAETIDGVESYKVTATFPQASAAVLVPGVTSDLPGTVWLERSTSRLVHAELRLPDGPGGKGGPVTVTFSDFDVPVSVTAP